MENRNTCPICNKIGIKDFLKEDVVCPCCGSDLSVYRKIDILSECNNNFHHRINIESKNNGERPNDERKYVKVAYWSL